MSRTRRLGPATLLRPLLGMGRAELVAYLRDRQQPFRTDTSNCDVRFTRNRIRNELLPLLAAQYNPSVVDALLRLGELAGESQVLIDAMIRDVAQQCLLHIARDEARLDLKVLAARPPHQIRELLMEVWRQQGWPLAAMGFAEWESLAAMIVAASGQSTGNSRNRMFPGAIVAEIHDGQLILTVL